MNKETFAQSIGLPLKYLYRLARRSARLYNSYYIDKKDGSKRLLECPNQELKGIQKWILQNILESIPLNDCCHGFRKKHGIKTNAKPHHGKNFIISIDIKSFFNSVSSNRIKNSLTSIGTIDPEIIDFILSFCTFRNHLPQGGVCSPYIANICFTSIDNKIESICAENRIVYTRYADDLTFSSNNKIKLNEIYQSVTEIIRTEGFQLNEKKTRFLSRRNRLEVTGIILNSKQLSIGRDNKKLIRSQIYRYIIKDQKEYENELLGRLSFIKDIEPKTYQSFIEYIDKLKKKKNLTTAST